MRMSKYLTYINDEYFKEINFEYIESKINKEKEMSKLKKGSKHRQKKKLTKGQEYIAKRGLDNIRKDEIELLDLLQQGLSDIKHLDLHGTKSLQNRVAVLSLNIEGYEAFDVGLLLDGDYNIAVRTGLHCAPKVHEQLGTAPTGSVRFGIGPLNAKDDILQAIEAVKELAPTRAASK